MILPIFPEGGLTGSVVTTVWVGVFVLVYFNLRFGWVLSGLVVPGYIVPLLILRPVAAGVVVIEAVLTYAIVWLISEKFSRGRYSALFGRDRFLGLILASVAVRVALDGWLLPIGAEWLSENFNRQFDWQSNLQSFGLIVVSLMANQFWKPGLVRGLLGLVVVTAISWFIIRYGLMEFTNFRLSGVTYAYEGLASSILASPKAYIILIMTAIFASQMNVRYGWDFSGILIPALIALQWYQPTKILTSFVEAAVVYLIARLVLKLPMLAGTTIEGGRKLVLFFNVSFAYKMVLGHVLVWLALDIKTTDFYGFGYLLSTLLAIKAHDKDVFTRLMRNTIEVSLAGAVLGNVIGFLLAWLVPAQLNAASITAPVKGASKGQDLLFANAVGEAWLRKSGGPQPQRSMAQAQELETAIALLASGGQPQFLAPALAENNMQLTRGADGVIAIAQTEKSGRELILFNPSATRNLAVVVEDAAQRPGIAAAALSLFKTQTARWMIISAKTAPQAAQVPSIQSSVSKASRASELIVTAGDSAKLTIAGKSAAALDLSALRRVAPDISAQFAPVSDANADIARLTLNAAHIEKLGGDALPPKVTEDCTLQNIKTAKRNKPDLPQMAYWRYEIAEPIAAALNNKTQLSPNVLRAAALSGLKFDFCMLPGQPVWRLTSIGGENGTMIFNPKGDHSKLIQSSPQTDVTLLASSAVFAKWGGALLIAADDSQLSGAQRNLLGIVTQSMIRAQGNEPGGLIQFRPSPNIEIAAQKQPSVVIMTDIIEQNSDWRDEIATGVAEANLNAVFVERGENTVGYEIGPNPAFRYLRQSMAKRYATIWVIRPEKTEPDDG
jgi:hypothetical protein